MIKFFRKIRQKLLSENKVSRYLLYAAGEILLVVIGILIALQINNQNEERKNRAKEEDFLRNIRKDLVINFNKVNNMIQDRNTRIEACNALISHIEGDPITDWHEFNMLTVRIYSWQRFYQHNYVFEELISSGNLSYIMSDSIKNLLFELESTYKQLKAEEDHWRFDSEELVFKPAYEDLDMQLIMRDYRGEHDLLDKEVFKDFLTNRKVKNGYVMARLEFEQMNSFSRQMKSIIFNLVDLIDKELEAGPGSEIKLFDSIGVIGSATESGWESSIPMEFTKGDERIWTIELRLSDGDMKFRGDNSWQFNWGGNTFPKGKLVRNGENIKVEAGQYRIIFDFFERTYEFEKLAD